MPFVGLVMYATNMCFFFSLHEVGFYAHFGGSNRSNQINKVNKRDSIKYLRIHIAQGDQTYKQFSQVVLSTGDERSFLSERTYRITPKNDKSSMNPFVIRKRSKIR